MPTQAAHRLPARIETKRLVVRRYAPHETDKYGTPIEWPA